MSSDPRVKRMESAIDIVALRSAGASVPLAVQHYETAELLKMIMLDAASLLSEVEP